MKYITLNVYGLTDTVIDTEKNPSYIPDENSILISDELWNEFWSYENRFTHYKFVNNAWVHLTDEEYKQVYWIELRKKEYGTPEEQVEFITENGLDAWQTKVAEIKAKYPNPTQGEKDRD